MFTHTIKLCALNIQFYKLTSFAFFPPSYIKEIHVFMSKEIHEIKTVRKFMKFKSANMISVERKQKESICLEVIHFLLVSFGKSN